MSRIKPILVALFVTLPAAAHESGVSELVVCPAATGVAIQWHLSMADQRHLESSPTLIRDGQRLHPKDQRQADDGGRIYHWDLDHQPGQSFHLPAIARLRHGHRVLVRDCQRRARSVLSARSMKLEVDWEGRG